MNERSGITSTRLAVLFLFGILFAHALVGCGRGGNEASMPPPQESMPPPTVTPPTAQQPTAEAWHGRFVGTVKIGDVDYYADALLTVDGIFRLYIGGPYVSDGTVQSTKPDGSAQFVGKFHTQSIRAFGNGVVIGQGCSAPHLVRFCSEAASGAIDIEIRLENVQGRIMVTTSAGSEAWFLNLRSWDNYYRQPAALGSLAGRYKEELAEFAIDGDTILNVDVAGRLDFQSAHSGCTGNGTLTPHGEFNVYDASATIERCNAPYIYLNGEYQGLTTTSPSAYWDYDTLLRIWLSQPEGAAPRAAVAMLGRPL